MNNKGTDPDFEAYREERNYRRRQRTKTERPGGSDNKVWEELNAQEEHEIQDRMLTRQVHDFFSDATKMAADIVTKVTEKHEEDVSAQLRDEMEEFLRDTIRRAAEFIEVLDKSGELGEEILEADMKNLVGRALDGFRAEGTAQVEDKHLGQDPFATELDSTTGSGQREDTDEADNDLLPTQHIDESELKLEPPSPAGEGSDFAEGFVGEAKAQRQLDNPQEEQAEQEEQAKPAEQEEKPATTLSGADKVKLREALKTMVRQGLMSKTEARETYRTKTGKS